MNQIFLYVDAQTIKLRGKKGSKSTVNPYLSPRHQFAKCPEQLCHQSMEVVEA